MGADEQSDYGTTWYAEKTPLPPPRRPLSYDLDVDVCVIGGGLAGLTAAREAARRGWSVAVLEARRIAWNASGRNTGVVLPGFSLPVEKIIERIGLPAASALWKLSQAGVQYIRDAIAETGDVGVIEGNGWLDVSKWPDADRILARIGILEEIGIDVERWQTERVRDALRSSHYFEAVYFPDGFQINPLAYALSLADAAAQAGVRIFENTPVTAADLAGIRKRIDTARARVRAGHVVLAGNVHLGGIVRSLADTLIPVTAYTGVTRPLGKRLAPAVAFHGAVSSSRHGDHHYRIVGQDRLLWTGSASAGALWPRTSLERTIWATFPQLGPVRFEHFWPARMGFAVHRMPQIGEVERGVWLASAFGGHGLNTSAMAGDLIARAIVERDDTWKRFMPFELVWAGGWAGRTVARTTAWWQRQSDAALALAARQREEFQRRRQEKDSAGAEALPTGDAAGKVAGHKIAATKFPATKFAGAKVPGLNLTLPSGYNPMPTLKRVLKGSFAADADDRPIDAPEAVPAAGPGDRSLEGAKRKPGQ
jgi:glycine/D-amino acid oxidase-like deaminating enzyme